MPYSNFKTIEDITGAFAITIDTEKARLEFIIAPLLIEVRRILDRKISLFSGTEFNVDDELGLNGCCDFLLSTSPDQVFIKTPVVCVVEAKNENIRSGYAQCIAGMMASRIFNERNATAFRYILGVVTTGSNWRFLKLESDTVSIDFNEYLISQAGKILGILVRAIKENSTDP